MPASGCRNGDVQRWGHRGILARPGQKHAESCAEGVFRSATPLLNTPATPGPQSHCLSPRALVARQPAPGAHVRPAEPSAPVPQCRHRYG